MKLTQQQKDFARHYVDTRDASHAALQAGYKSTANASRIRNTPLVAEEIERLQSKIESPAIMSITKRAEVLSENALVAMNNGDIRAGVACIAELNKMTGGYQPERKEVDVTGSIILAQILESLTDQPL